MSVPSGHEVNLQFRFPCPVEKRGTGTRTRPDWAFLGKPRASGYCAITARTGLAVGRWVMNEGRLCERATLLGKVKSILAAARADFPWNIPTRNASRPSGICVFGNSVPNLRSRARPRRGLLRTPATHPAGGGVGMDQTR